MENTTLEYPDYDSSSPVGPTQVGTENNLSSNLSIFFYFMFLFNVCVNGLVLVIIHRWAKTLSENSTVHAATYKRVFKYYEMSSMW